MTFRPLFVPASNPVAVGIRSFATPATSVRAGATASGLRSELWIQSDANGGIRVALGTRFTSPETPGCSEIAYGRSKGPPKAC
jgi:hypothetical protein